jgi:hypothetical protein
LEEREREREIDRGQELKKKKKKNNLFSSDFHSKYLPVHGSLICYQNSYIAIDLGHGIASVSSTYRHSGRGGHEIGRQSDEPNQT